MIYLIHSSYFKYLNNKLAPKKEPSLYISTLTVKQTLPTTVIVMILAENKRRELFIETTNNSLLKISNKIIIKIEKHQ